MPDPLMLPVICLAVLGVVVQIQLVVVCHLLRTLARSQQQLAEAVQTQPRRAAASA